MRKFSIFSPSRQDIKLEFKIPLCKYLENNGGRQNDKVYCWKLLLPTSKKIIINMFLPKWYYGDWIKKKKKKESTKVQRRWPGCHLSSHNKTSHKNAPEKHLFKKEVCHNLILFTSGDNKFHKIEFYEK